ncbi:MAG: hypothetical protein PHD51_02325 [Patescibacteria group bacterium]|nr:hypothetical protein [Patescibacteria group bacterium]MDD5490303.1 hypothetical protein [Patescibacteria group bacterium]
MTSNNIIIGLAGKIACGKETVGKYILQKNPAGTKIKFSDPLRQALDIFNIPKTRENLQDVSTILRGKFGEEILAEAMYKLTTNSPAPLVIVDGVRRLADIKKLKELNNFYLIYIKTDAAKRYKRYITRGENVGEAEMTYEQFKNRDGAETEEQIESLEKEADFIIDNDDDFDDLYKQIDKILEKIKK